MHSLPSPVSRRGQKPYKPEFFDNIKAARAAEDALTDVQGWLRDVGLHRIRYLIVASFLHQVDGHQSLWTRQQIALEMGSLLKSYDSPGLI